MLRVEWRRSLRVHSTKVDHRPNPPVLNRSFPYAIQFCKFSAYPFQSAGHVIRAAIHGYSVDFFYPSTLRLLARPNLQVQVFRLRRRPGQPCSLSFSVRTIHIPTAPNTTETPPRNTQNQAKPFASASCTESVISPRALNPVMATPKHIAENIAAMTMLNWAVIFKMAPGVRFV